MSEIKENSNEVKKDDSLDLMKYIKQLWPLRKKLIKISCVIFVVAVVIAFFVPRKYTVAVTLAPEAGQNGEGVLSGVASMFGIGGMGMGENADALTAQLYPEIVSSTPFLVDMLDVKVKTANGKIETTLGEYTIKHYITLYHKIKSSPRRLKAAITKFWKEPMVIEEGGSSYFLSELESAKVSILRQLIDVAVDKKTSVTTIMVTFNDPMVTAMVADALVEKLQKRITEYRLAKSLDDCRYWEQIYEESKEDYFKKQDEYARYVDANKNLVRQSVIAEQERLQNEALLAYQIYSNVATQLQVARAKVQEAKPAFAVVQPATLPYEQAGTGKTTIALILTFLGIVVAIAWLLFGKEYWNLAKGKYKEFKKDTDKEVSETKK